MGLVTIDKLSNKISSMSSGIHRIDLDKILDLGKRDLPYTRTI